VKIKLHLDHPRAFIPFKFPVISPEIISGRRKTRQSRQVIDNFDSEQQLLPALALFGY
jgi:hypothetical protein